LIGCREEVEAGETQLFLEGGRPLREVAVLNVLLKNSKGQTLYEAEQVGGWMAEGGWGSGTCNAVAVARQGRTARCLFASLPTTSSACAGAAQRQPAHAGAAPE
jgi:hypothetical protein